jgi:hypothetical protein
MYVTSSRGVLKSTSASADFSLAGMPRCLDLVLTLSSAGTPVLLTDTGAAPTAGADQARAYRGVWCQRDANNNLVQGAPSSRAYIANTAAATRDVSVAVSLPPEITTNHFFQLYASAIVDNGTVVDPGDELRLVNEYFPTTSDIAAGSLTIVDIVPDAFRKDDLYTNATQLGIARQFDRPPLARDLAWFNNKLICSNFTDPQRMDLLMLGTSAMVTQTITLAGVVYTAGTAEATSTGTFQVFKSGGGGYTDKGTQALNVDFTARSLCNVINKYAANTTVYAYYVSAGSDVPGKIQIEERGIGGSAFTITASTSAMGNSFSPVIPTSGTTYTSVAERRVNFLRVSEENQPEHMSRARNIIVGGADEEIQRIIPLKTSLLIIKDHSLWRLSFADVGEAPVLLDNTVGIRGRDTAATLNNACYFLSDQGFVCATENGIQIVGRPIEDRIIAGLRTKSADYAHQYFVGQGVERERYYICSVYDVSSGLRTCYRYSPISNAGRGAWTKRKLNVYGFAVTDSRLYYILYSNAGNILRQRASRLDGTPWYRDFCEETSTATITAINSTALTMTVTISAYVDYADAATGVAYNAIGPSFGAKLYKSSATTVGSAQCVVTGASTDNGALSYTFPVNSVTGFAVNDVVTIFRAIPWKVEYAPILGGNPLVLKTFCEVLAKAETASAFAVDVSFANQVDTKSDPASDEWVANPTAQRVYIPAATGVAPSSTANDFPATSAVSFNPNNEIRTLVDPARAQGEHLAVRLAGGVAEGFAAIKAIVVSVASSGSTRGRQ